jgi:hypothetical protein
MPKHIQWDYTQVCQKDNKLQATASIMLHSEKNRSKWWINRRKGRLAKEKFAAVATRAL